MKSVLILAALATIVLSLGCATDPNKGVKDADAAHAADVRDTKEETARLEAGQEKDHAALDSEHTKQDANMDKQAAEDHSKYDQQHDAAESNVVEARRTFRAAATARLQQVDAKAVVLEGKRAAKKITEPSLATLRTNCAAVKASVANLDTVSDANWFATKKAVETNLAALEKDVNDIEARL